MNRSTLLIGLLSILLCCAPCLAGSARPPLSVTEIKKLPDGSTVFKLAGGGTVVYGPGADPSGFEKLVGSSQRAHVTGVQPSLPPRPWELPQTPRLPNGMIGWKNADGTYTKFGCGGGMGSSALERRESCNARRCHLARYDPRTPPEGDCSHSGPSR